MTLPVRAPASAACSRRSRSPVASLQASARALARVPGQEHPGQGDVLELAQVAEVVRRPTGPARAPSRARQPACPARPSTRARHRRDRAHVGEEVADVHGAPPRRAGRARRPDLPRPPGPAPSRPASDTGSAAARRARPAPGCAAGAAWRRRRSSRSRWSSLMPDVHVGRPPQHRPALLAARQLQAPARRCASRRGDGLARSGCRPGRSRSRARRRCARPAAGSPCTRRTPRCAASRSPLAQDASPSSACGPAAPEVVVRRRRGRAPAGRASRCRPHRPATSACAGAVHRDRAREAAELLLVHDDHRRLTGASIWHCQLSCVQPPLGVPQARLDALELAARHQRPDKPDAEHGPARGAARRGAPRASRRSVASCRSLRIAGMRQLDQVGRPLEVLGGQRVVDRLGRLAVLLVPALARRCSSGTAVGLLVQQVRLQHVGEEVVVAIPAAPVVERDQEQVRLAPAPPASPVPPSWPVTASHSGPLSRSRIEVCSRKLLDLLGLALQAPPRPGSRRCSGRPRRSRR